eukprot:12751347-Alexandrium_andersonii.AAC.1
MGVSDFRPPVINHVSRAERGGRSERRAEVDKGVRTGTREMARRGRLDAWAVEVYLSLIHISEPTRLALI